MGKDFATLNDAIDAFNANPNGTMAWEAAFIEIDGPGIYHVRKNKGFDSSDTIDTDAWRVHG